MLDLGDLLIHKKVEKKLTNHAKNSLAKAFVVAKKRKVAEIESIHFLYSIYLEKGSSGYTIMKDFGIKKEFFAATLPANKEKASSRTKIKPVPSEEFKKVFARAFSLAKELHYSYVGTEHFLCAILASTDEKIKKFLGYIRNEKIEDLPRMIAENNQMFDLGRLFSENTASVSSPLPDFFPDPSGKKLSRTQQEGSPTSYLEKFCLNLNEEIKTRAEHVIGREEETRRIISILGRKSKNNPLLIGPPGVGKTALAWKLAELLNSDCVPPFLMGKTIFSLDVAALVAGTGFRGEFEMRLKEIIRELSQNREFILFIDELHNIIGAGNISGSLDLANILKPALGRGDIQIIGATTLREFKKYIEKDSALERRFQPVSIKEPDIEETKKILSGLQKDYESFHGVSISDEAIELSVEMSSRYIRDRFLPDKAIDVLDETAAGIRAEDKISGLTKKIAELEKEKKKIRARKEKHIAEENYETAMHLRDLEKELEEKIGSLKAEDLKSKPQKAAVITASDIINTISKISGIPVEKLAKTPGQKMKNIAQILSSQIIGQKEAITDITNVILKSQFGLGSPERPLGSFLMLGPSGVGKTHTARILAREFFGSPKALIRFDMSEFMERHSVSALIGSPAGYIGFGEGGRLTEKIRQNPYSVVLFDEIEKAHPDVFNVLLQILEDGILTDAEGTQVSFRNTIVILTANIGTDEFSLVIPKALGFKTGQKNDEPRPNKIETIRKNVLAELEDRMRPELLNRLDHIIVFNPLTKTDIEKITAREITDLMERLERQGLKLIIKSEVADHIAKYSFNNNQGARLIRKNIGEMIENKIARMMIEEKVKKNKITVSVSKGKLKLI